jgi:cation diffusion facilitator family transporter
VLFNAGLVFYESAQKVIDPRPMTNLGWVAAAAVVGFLGNELVALYRLRIGREIGSAALVADGLHARTDGLTSLGVLAGVIGVWLGFPLADPIAGFAIGVAILAIAIGAAREMWFRAMDATDPALTERIEAVAHSVKGVLDVHNVALRWVGRPPAASCTSPWIVRCRPMRATRGEEVRRQVFRDLPALDEMTIQVDPCRVNNRPGASHRLSTSLALKQANQIILPGHASLTHCCG